MSRPVVIIGASTAGLRVLHVLLARIAMDVDPDPMEFAGFLDDGCPELTDLPPGLPGVIGGVRVLPSLPADVTYLVGLGSGPARRIVAGWARSVGRHPVSAVHPEASIHRQGDGEGLVVGAGATVAPGAVLGAHVHLGAGSSVGPRARIGDFVTIQDRVCIGADVTVGEEVTVTDDAVVEAGSAVDRGEFVRPAARVRVADRVGTVGLVAVR